MTEPGKIEKAVEKMNNRKTAVGSTFKSGVGGDRSFAQLMLSGYDFNLDELDHYRRHMVLAAVESITRNKASGKSEAEAITIAIASVWVDGVVVGVEIGRDE